MILLLSFTYSCSVSSAAASGGTGYNSGSLEHEPVILPPQGQENPLKDLQGVGLLIEIPEDLERAGIDANAIRRDVEFDLRMSGLRILTEEQLQLTEGQPLFSVNILNVTLGNYEQFIVNVEVGLYEQAILLRRDMMQRRSGIVDGLTWFTQDIDFYDQFRLYTDLRQRVKELVGLFVAEYKAARR